MMENKKVLKKRILSGLLGAVILVGGVISTRATYANAYEVEEKPVYFGASFQSQTDDNHYANLDFNVEFKMNFGNSLDSEDGKSLESWKESLTEKDMKKSGDMYYITAKSYPLYKHDFSKKLTSGVSHRAVLRATENNKDYYLGYGKYSANTLRIKGEDIRVYLAEYPILKLNRNIEKTKLNYETGLKAEDKATIIQKVKAANPNLTQHQAMSFKDENLIISNIGREDSLKIPVESLVIRVKDTGIQTDEKDTKDSFTQTTPEIKVIYQFKDGKVYKEFKVSFYKGYMLDASELEMLPDDMKFSDDFMFYEVKGDGTDKIVRTVEKIGNEQSDKGTQTDKGVTRDTWTQTDKPKTSDTGTQTEKVKTKDKGVQTELSKDDISKMETEAKELKSEIDKLNSEIKDKDKLNDQQKEKIKDLEEKIDSLKDKIEEDKCNKGLSDEMKKELEKLTQKINELEKKIAEINKSLVTSNLTSPISPISDAKTSSSNSSKAAQASINNSGKGSSDTLSSGNITKDSVNKETKEREIRYPNKLTPKAPANNSSQDSSMDASSKTTNTNKGVASSPSKARGSVTENVDNANHDYPIHHGDETDCYGEDMYSADARQFVTFQTKSGKTFHLIINHDEDSENVMLLTEVSEDDLLNMVETKEKTTKEATPQKEIEEPKETPKKEEKKSDLGTYILLAIVVLSALGGGYYFKVMKNKEKEELENLEEEDDFFSEAEEYEESEASETEDI